MTAIELVVPADVDEIEPLCRRAFEQVQYAAPPRCYCYDSEHIRKTVLTGLARPDRVQTKYVRDGVIIGYMAVGITDFSFYAVNELACFEIVWHGDPLLPPAQQLQVQVSLLKDMIKRVGKVTTFSLALDSHYLQLSRVVAKLGFKETTRTFVRRSPWATL